MIYNYQKTQLQNQDKMTKDTLDKIQKIVNMAQNIQAKDNAILFFQRLLRGRAIQNQMFEGKEKRLALIHELLDVAATEKLKQSEQEEILELNHEEIAKDAILEAIQGDVITKTLDILAKELIRFKHVRPPAHAILIFIGEEDFEAGQGS